MNNPLVTLHISGGAAVVLELLPAEAPNTVNSFLSLARQGCFDGHAIERIVPGYVVDMSYTAFGRAECRYLIENEARAAGGPCSLRLEPGVVAMGGYGEEGISGGEFFFPLAYSEKLDGSFPGFGRVVRGLETVLGWGEAALRPVAHSYGEHVKINVPVEPVVLERVTMETFGVEYPAPRRKSTAFVPATWRTTKL